MPTTTMPDKSCPPPMTRVPFCSPVTPEDRSAIPVTAEDRCTSPVCRPKTGPRKTHCLAYKRNGICSNGQLCPFAHDRSEINSPIPAPNKTIPSSSNSTDVPAIPNPPTQSSMAHRQPIDAVEFRKIAISPPESHRPSREAFGIMIRELGALAWGL
uniref:C3H1-type domain-containing protein n=1 Tax=Panagrellus redivivus TaxID=6233 RepID=A0A7E4ZXN9_PANRE